MSGAWGADPDQLEDLGRSMGRSGDRIEQMANEISALYRRDQWRGADADQARRRWESSLRGQLAAVSTALQEFDTVLRRQAAEQRAASGSETGGLVGTSASIARGSVAGSTAPSRNWFSDMADRLDAAANAALVGGTVMHFLGKAGRVGDYSDFYRRFASAFHRMPNTASFKLMPSTGDIPEFLRFKKSPVLQTLTKIPIIERYSPKLSDAFKRAGRFLNPASIVMGVAAAGSEFQQGNIASGTVRSVDVVGDSLKESKVLYPFGVMVAAIHSPLEAALDADFSAEGWAYFNEGLARNPGALGEEFGKAAKETPGMLLKIFL